MSTPLPVICLAGPTGGGKTEAAIALARELNGEIVNADSRQVYASFPLITAQPSPEEHAACPHHLYGFLPTAQKISAGRWAERAVETVRDILARGRTAILVGGTGLYFQTLLHGIAAIPPVPPEETARWEARLDREGAPALHALLAGHDPDYAARIHPNDRQRIVRALEVHAVTGRPFSWWHTHAMSAPLCTGPLFYMAPTLDWLTPRLARRIDVMLEKGALDEARAARLDNDDPAAPGWSGIGCAEVLSYLRGDLTLEECRHLWLRNTRAYAKRQLTWFRGRPQAIACPPADSHALLRLVTAQKT